MDKSILPIIDRTIQQNATEQIDFLRELVKTSSANPYTPDESKPYEPVERDIARIIFEKLIEIGLQPNMDGVSSERPNVVATLGPAGTKSLILNGHMDTVMPNNGWSYSPFEGEIHNNRLYGLGAVDMKASLTVFAYATKAILDSGIELAGSLILTFVVDEEPGACSSLGTRYLLENGLKADAAIVAEPGNRNVGIGHRGGYRFRITVHGEAIHTGYLAWERGHKGRNAIQDMARVIDAVTELQIPYIESGAFKNRKPVVTFPTLISGGTSINTVPASCVAYGDCRLLPGGDAATVSKILRARLDEIPGLVYTLEDILAVPPVEISDKEPIVQIVRNRAREILGKEPSTIATGPWNDGWMFIEKGIPTVCGFGPRGGGVHAADEFVYIDSLIDTTRIFVRVILDYLGTT